MMRVQSQRTETRSAGKSIKPSISLPATIFFQEMKEWFDLNFGSVKHLVNCFREIDAFHFKNWKYEILNG